MDYYVVWYEERLRDGMEDGAKIFESVEEALKFIEYGANRWFAASNHTFKLFKLGAEVPIQLSDIKTEKKEVVIRKQVSLGK